jgi:hypothetical protein
MNLIVTSHPQCNRYVRVKLNSLRTRNARSAEVVEQKLVSIASCDGGGSEIKTDQYGNLLLIFKNWLVPSS